MRMEGRPNPHARPHRMKLDPQTLHDLEIFRSADDGQSLFDALDRTRTSGGRKELRQRFRSPLSDPQEIRDVQNAVRFLIDHSNAFLALREERLLSTAEEYLHSNYATASANGPLSRLLEGTWVRFRDRPFLDHAVAGVAVVRGLAQELTQQSAWTSRSQLPALLEGIFSGMRLREPISHALLSRGEVGHWSPGLVLAMDRKLRTEWRNEIQQIIHACFQLDALCSMAEETARRRFVFPQVVDETEPPTLRVDGLYHPFLERPVRNNLSVTAEQPLVFLTGPNMAGKTTYLRATALSVYLAQIGMGVPANEMRLSPFDEIVTGIHTFDSVRQGYSYFLSEVRRVKQAVGKLASGDRVLVIFDEMFRGTNVKDAYDASLAVVAGFARCRTSAILVSSHLAELVPALVGTLTAQTWYFEAEIRGGVPTYRYEMRPGSSAQRLGLLLLEQEGVFALLDRLGTSSDLPVPVNAATIKTAPGAWRFDGSAGDRTARGG